MRTHNVCKIVTTVALLLICGAAFAQKEDNASREIWKKKVARVIDMAQKEDNTNHHLTDMREDTTMLEMMVSAIKNGKLTAYSNFDADFTTKLSPEGLREMMTSKPDTIEVVDPITNARVVKIVRRDFDNSLVHKYRILEEWAFNPHTGITSIQIIGIAPLREVYDENGSFRGVQAMFWVRYNDVRNIIAKYEQYHPDNSLSGHIWADYFLSDVKPEGVK